jgi:hypothetical protein
MSLVRDIRGPGSLNTSNLIMPIRIVPARQYSQGVAADIRAFLLEVTRG